MPRKSRAPDPDRRWRIPPIPAHASHSFAGAVLLEELSGPVGFALWQSFRDVQLWSLTPPRERAGLFAPGAAAARAVTLDDAELRAPVRTLLSMVEAPSTARMEQVAGACATIARWADAEGATGSALAFAEAAASASPDDAALAFAAGRLARRRAEYARAETWYMRAAGLGRRSGDWESYAMAWVGMGKLQIQRGTLQRARKSLLRALRVARRTGHREAEGMALHNLFVVDTENGDLRRAEAWARDAYRVYGTGHADLPRLAHDLALVWVMRGHFARAEAVFRAILPHLTYPADRLFLLANLVRAAGGAGDRDTFHAAWAEAWELAASPGAQDGLSRAMIDLARGAASLHEWQHAERAASRAAEFAAEHGEARARIEAEQLLGAVRAHAAQPDAAPGAASAESVAADALAAEIIAGLNASVGA